MSLHVMTYNILDGGENRKAQILDVIQTAKPDYKDNLTKAEIFEHLRSRFDKMYIPDDVVFIDAVPKTSVGKFDKKVLREQYKDYQLPE